jgi:hypothetical protein
MSEHAKGNNPILPLTTISAEWMDWLETSIETINATLTAIQASITALEARVTALEAPS